DLAGRHTERDIGNRREVAVSFGEVLHFDHGQKNRQNNEGMAEAESCFLYYIWDRQFLMRVFLLVKLMKPEYTGVGQRL
ncbi:MAG: hypothetical protein ACREQ3_14805, partial [Candidatus Binatia bacterium]